MNPFRKELIVNILGVFFVIGLTIFYSLQYKNNLQKISPSTNTNVNLPTTNTPLTLAEIQKHNSAGDCWVIISGNVYNVTSYVNMHPGGASRISSYCGQDMTQAFLSQPHSSVASQLHAEILLGPLNGQTSTQNIQNTQNNLTQPTSNNFRRGGGDD